MIFFLRHGCFNFNFSIICVSWLLAFLQPNILQEPPQPHMKRTVYLHPTVDSVDIPAAETPAPREATGGPLVSTIFSMFEKVPPCNSC